MQFPSFLVAFLIVSLCAQGQSNTGPASEVPQDSRALFAAAAPFYDFNSANLKPWHLKASYQIFDETGKPTEKGIYEYWWASPQVHRSTWSRPSATYMDWYTANGKHAYSATGVPLEYFEHKLEGALLSPLPQAAELDAAKVRLERKVIKFGDQQLPCIMVIPQMPPHGQIQDVPFGLFPTYCFGAQLPVIRASYSFGTVATDFNKISKVQNRFLAQSLTFMAGKIQILTASVDEINGISASDPALTAPSDAIALSFNRPRKVNISASISSGMLVKKQVPVYPQDAKDARISGTVGLQATIGRDGGVRDLHVIGTPSASMAESALWAVCHWQYKPYLLNGEPVEFETSISVIYSLRP